jgi:hypothetical protein
MRRLAVLLAACAALGACTGQDGGTTRLEQATVVGVTLDVPRGWDRADLDAPDMQAHARFSPDGGATTFAQVVVGCGEQDADALVVAAVGLPREAAVATDVDDAARVQVDGFEAARRTTITFGTGRDLDRNTLRAAGLYATGHGALVLVEVMMPYASFDAAMAERVLDSVHADADVLAAGCAG